MASTSRPQTSHIYPSSQRAMALLRAGRFALTARRERLNGPSLNLTIQENSAITRASAPSWYNTQGPRTALSGLFTSGSEDRMSTSTGTETNRQSFAEAALRLGG